MGEGREGREEREGKGGKERGERSKKDNPNRELIIFYRLLFRTCTI